MGFSRQAFSVLWVVERSRNRRLRVGVVGPYHRRHHRSNAQGLTDASKKSAANFFGGFAGREIILSCRRLVGAVWLTYCLVAEGGKEAEVKLAQASAAIARLVRS
jgi:hypothetical protein